MFVVNRLNWYYDSDAFVRMPGEFRVGTFDTAEEAHAAQRILETGARALVNPFAGGIAPFEQSNMPEPVLCDWLQDHGIEPPDADVKTARRNWAKWWKATAPKWSAEQRASVWEALDRARFFEVVEEPERSVVYTVAEADEHYHPAHFTGLRAAYRSRNRAEKECAKRNKDVLEEEHGPEEDPVLTDPIAPFRNPSDNRYYYEDRPVGNWPNGTPFFLTVPIEIEGQPKDRLFVVTRVVTSVGHDGTFWGPMEEGDAYSFVRAFGSQEAADAFCAEKTRQAQEIVAPGRIQTPTFPELVGDLVELGLTPPVSANIAKDGPQIVRWWATIAGTATREQRLAVWKWLDVPLFVVLETKLID